MRPEEVTSFQLPWQLPAAAGLAAVAAVSAAQGVTDSRFLENAFRRNDPLRSESSSKIRVKGNLYRGVTPFGQG